MSGTAETIVVWHAYHGAEERALGLAAEAFEREAGGDVELVAVPWGGFDAKVETAVPRGNGPDVLITGHVNIGKWSKLGVIEPVVPIEGLRPFTVDALTYDGRVWGEPLSFKSAVLLYDPAVIASPPRTTDELVELAARHTGGGSYGIAYEASTAYYHGAWLHGFGGSVLDDGIAAIDSAPSVAALAFVAALGPYLPMRPTADRVGQLYDEGRAAMVVSGPWFVADRTRTIAAATLPIVSATGLPSRPYLTVEAAMLCPGHAPSAGAFAAFLAGPTGATIRRDEGLQAVAADIPLDDPLLSVLAAQAENAVPMPVDPDVQTAFEAEQRALRRVLRGAASPQDAASEAQAYWRSLTKPRPIEAAWWPYALGGAALALVSAAFAARTLGHNALAIRRQWWDYLWVLPAAVAVFVLVAVPFVVGAAMSLFAHWHGEAVFVGADNFVSILTSRDWPITSPMSFFYALAVTVAWTVANVTLHVGLGVALALALREPWIRLRPVFRALLVLPWAVPSYITALIWRTMFDAQYGAINQLLGAQIDWFGTFFAAFAANLATNTWLGFPFMMVVTLGALQAIPRDLEEAAMIDGATYGQRFRHVVWPLLAPALLPAVVMGSVWTFNMFIVVRLVSDGEPDGATELLVSQAYKWAFSRGNLYGYASAYAVIIFFVLLAYSRVTARLLRRVNP